MGQRTGAPFTAASNMATTGSESVTVPADCTAIVAEWHFWGVSGLTLTSCGVDNVDFTILQNATQVGGFNGCGIAVLANPSAGSQTFDWVWSATPASNGCTIVLTFVKDVDTADLVRDSAFDRSDNSSANASVTLTTNLSDLVLASCSSDSTPAIDATVYIDNYTVGAETWDFCDKDSVGASTTDVDMTGGSFPSMVGVSLKNSSGGGMSESPYMQFLKKLRSNGGL